MAYLNTPIGGGSEGSAITTIAASGTAQTLNIANPVYDITLTGNCTLTFSGSVTSGYERTLSLTLRQDGTGSRTVTWPASVTWLSGAVPVLHTAANAVDTVILYTVNGGTTWYGAAASFIGPGYEFDYAQITSPVTVTATSSATATTVVTGNAVTYDGGTTIQVEFSAQYISLSVVGGVYLVLYDGSSSIGTLSYLDNLAAAAQYVGPTYARSPHLTPSAGAHTYSIRAYKDSGGSAAVTVTAGAGGAGTGMPAFMRITKV